MLNQYMAIQNGADVCKFFSLPDELKDYRVRVVIEPIVVNSKNKKFENFKKSLRKYNFSLPNNFEFNRDEIYEHLDE